VIAFLVVSFRRAAALGGVALIALAGIVDLAVASPAVASPAVPPCVLVVGDSLSAGYGLTAGEGWVDLLQHKLASSGYPHRVVNASISGDTTSGGRSRIAGALQLHRPRVVIIELGGNDGLRGTALGVVKTNLESIVDAVQAAGARALVVGMQLPPNYGASYVRQFRELFADVAKTRHAAYLPFILEGFAERPELFQADRIHPTAQAQPLMMEAVWRELVKLIRRP
jgi:acyl-CoA thioesterase-1